WEGWAILLRQKQKKLIMLPSETMIWQPEFTDKTLSRKPGAVQNIIGWCHTITRTVNMENSRSSELPLVAIMTRMIQQPNYTWSCQTNPSGM
ncbi:hypothetical protein, partial [Escherichia coli]|uniref:hypothetical protein n=1 Tax=Escherichia coli TaxID=562 RepID=UPI001BE408ED